MSNNQITERLAALGEMENHQGETPGQRRERLIKFEKIRQLMIYGRGQFNKFKLLPPPIFYPKCL